MTSFVPSGKVASTWISGIISGTPSMTCCARKQRRAVAHELGHRPAVARAFHDRRGDVGDGFGIVELHSARETALRQQRGGEEQQLVLLSRREFHRILSDELQVLQMRGATASRPAIERPQQTPQRSKIHARRACRVAAIARDEHFRQPCHRAVAGIAADGAARRKQLVRDRSRPRRPGFQKRARP